MSWKFCLSGVNSLQENANYHAWCKQDRPKLNFPYFGDTCKMC
jgi:hypothetical protein